MRKFLVWILILSFLLPSLVFAQSQEPIKPERKGLTSCLIGCCFGSRVGYMYNEGVGIRTWEILELLTGIAVIVSLIEIYNGKTWTEIEQKEELRDPEFKEWHKWMTNK